MALRANWHTDAVDVDRSDPFGDVTSTPPAKSASGDFRRLTELVRAEGRLADAGTLCELKERDWSHPTCIACPERGSRGPLCGLGVAQETIVALGT